MYKLPENLDIKKENPKDAIVLNDVKGKITFKNFSFSYPNSNKEFATTSCLL